MTTAHSTSRYSNRVSFVFLVSMVLFAVLLASGGVTYAVFKHKQVEERTKIDELQREIVEYKMTANQHRAKVNALTGRWTMLTRLKEDGSQLRDIEQSQIEVARSLSRHASRHATASR